MVHADVRSKVFVVDRRDGYECIAHDAQAGTELDRRRGG
jgi:hypothetical protein